MNKTIVSIISAQAVPSFLFIKDFYEKGDNLLFFTTKTVYKPKDYIVEAIRLSEQISDNQIKTCELSEENWPLMLEQITKALNGREKLVVNTTGGTKYMSMAVQEVCKKMPNTELYYIPYPRNVYLKQDGTEIPIRYKISIKEYVTASKLVKYTKKKCCKNSDYTNSFFNIFIKGLDEIQIEIINKIRTNFRAQKFGIDDINEVNDKPTQKITNQGKKNEKVYDFEQIEGIVDFLSKIHFPFEGNKLTFGDVEYITGGWFEEYMYHIIEKFIQPDDINLGLVVNQSDSTNPNDLDVVFTKGNKLFVIECKTGISAIGDKTETGMFKEIAYKAASIRASLLGGLSEKSMICSLSDGKESSRKTAKNMGITYYDKSFFVDNARFDEFIGDILKHANLNQPC